MEKERIQFKPLHDGMGFHPFSDGLPYAPESKAKTKPVTSSGAGAVAAGRPQFSTHIPSTSTKATARQLQEQRLQEQRLTQSLVAPEIITTHLRSGKIPPAPQVRNPQPEPTVKGPVLEQQNTGILRRRAFAYLMDTVIHAGFWLSTNLAALFFFNFQLDAVIVEEHFSQFLMFFLVSQWLFIALQEMLFETTIGKAFFNLEFKRNHRSLFLRSIVFMLGFLAGGLGLFYRPQDRWGQLQLTQRLYSA